MEEAKKPMKSPRNAVLTLLILGPSILAFVVALYVWWKTLP
jgi:hypothetical protein